MGGGQPQGSVATSRWQTWSTTKAIEDVTQNRSATAVIHTAEGREIHHCARLRRLTNGPRGEISYVGVLGAY